MTNEQLQKMQRAIEHNLDHYLEMNVANGFGHIIKDELLSVYLLFEILGTLESIDGSLAILARETGHYS